MVSAMRSRSARTRPRGTSSASAWVLRAFTIFVIAAFALSGRGAATQSAFYRASPQQIAGEPGTLIRQQSLGLPAPLGASALRVLYRSTGLSGEPIAVSGAILIPKGPPPPGGWPIVAWAHPTTGVVPRCAPSLAMFLIQQIQGSREMMRRGFVVAATDYPGLGTPEAHPYRVGVSEARAVLDSVRAARQLTGASPRFAVWGHSQGGQAALFTGMSATYAPDLDLVGVAAAAPATDLAALLAADIDTTGGRNLTAMTVWSWSRVFGAPMDRVVDPAALPIVNLLAGECIESIYDLLRRRGPSRLLEQKFLAVKDFYTTEPWRSLMAANTPTTLPPRVPVFLAQGTADEIVRPDVTQNYMRRLCREGSRVHMMLMQDINHGLGGRASAGAAVDWMAARFAETAVPNDCDMHQ
jgi:acetyl esterase/lipase